MSKISCNVIQDIMPLYVDEIVIITWCIKAKIYE